MLWSQISSAEGDDQTPLEGFGYFIRLKLNHSTKEHNHILIRLAALHHHPKFSCPFVAPAATTQLITVPVCFVDCHADMAPGSQDFSVIIIRKLLFSPITFVSFYLVKLDHAECNYKPRFQLATKTKERKINVTWTQ